MNGTPTFFINGQRHDGDFELETLGQAINKAAGKIDFSLSGKNRHSFAFGHERSVSSIA